MGGTGAPATTEAGSRNKLGNFMEKEERGRCVRQTRGFVDCALIFGDMRREGEGCRKVQES